MRNQIVGVIGLGRMGGPMARRLAGKGFPVYGYDVAPEALRCLAEAGGQIAGSPRDLAEKCDVVITMLPGPPEVEAVVLGQEGVASGMRPGAVLLEMSTSSPALSRRIAARLEERGARFLDCPVSGGLASSGVVAAERGELTLMVGGQAEVLEQCREVLEPMSSSILHLGEVGAGHTAKLLNQMLLMVESVLVMEVLAVAARSGINLPTLFDLVTRSTGNSWCWQNRIPRVLGGDTRVAPLELWHKDLGLATAAGREAGIPLFVAEAAFQVLQMARSMGLGSEDGSIALARMHERVAGVRLSP